MTGLGRNYAAEVKIFVIIKLLSLHVIPAYNILIQICAAKYTLINNLMFIILQYNSTLS